MSVSVSWGFPGFTWFQYGLIVQYMEDNSQTFMLCLYSNNVHPTMVIDGNLQKTM